MWRTTTSSSHSVGLRLLQEQWDALDKRCEEVTGDADDKNTFGPLGNTRDMCMTDGCKRLYRGERGCRNRGVSDRRFGLGVLLGRARVGCWGFVDGTGCVAILWREFWWLGYRHKCSLSCVRCCGTRPCLCLTPCGHRPRTSRHGSSASSSSGWSHWACWAIGESTFVELGEICLIENFSSLSNCSFSPVGVEEPSEG